MQVTLMRLYLLLICREREMIDTSSVVGALDKLAQQVKDSDSGASARLTLLSEAVQHNANTSAWAYTDVHAMIAPYSIVERYRNNVQKNGIDRTVTWLETIRNTFIFLPIIVTWLSISQATDKYNELISTAIQQKKLDLYSQPFLYLWQQRFGGTLPAFLTLSN